MLAMVSSDGARFAGHTDDDEGELVPAVPTEPMVTGEVEFGEATLEPICGVCPETDIEH